MSHSQAADGYESRGRPHVADVADMLPQTGGPGQSPAGDRATRSPN